MEKDSLKRSLSLTSLTFYGTGMILGAGIYSVIGSAAGIVGFNLWLSFLLSAFCATLTALSYCELSTLLPKAGAEYVYMEKGFPGLPWLATAVGLLMAFAGTSTASAVALAFGGYLRDFIAFDPLWSGVGLIVFLTVVNIMGIQESSRLNIAFTLVELGGLILFIYIGFSAEKIPEIFKQPLSPHLLQGTALIIFAYFGFEDIVNLTEEAKNPSDSIPKAILWSLVISTVIYLLVSLAAVSITSLEKLSMSQAPLMDAVMGKAPKMAMVLGVCALFSTANTVLIALLAASRSFFGMSKDRAFPGVFSLLHPKRQTPWLASLLVMVLAIALIPFGAVEVIAGVSSFATLLGFLAVNVVLIRLRYKAADQSRPFKVPLSLGKLPVLPALGALTTLILLFQFEPKVYAIFFYGLIFLLLVFAMKRLSPRIRGQ